MDLTALVVTSFTLVLGALFSIYPSNVATFDVLHFSATAWLPSAPEHHRYTLAQSPVDTNPITYGQTLDGMVGTSNQTISYTFEANQGDLILASMADASLSFGPALSLYAPDNNLLASTSGGYAASNIEITRLLTVTGPYQLVAKERGTATGDFGLFLQRLNGPVGGSELAFDQAVPGVKTQVAQMGTHVFTASENDSIAAVLTASVSAGGSVRLYGGDGSLLATGAAQSGYAEVNRALPVAGPYMLLTELRNVAAGTYGLVLNRLNGATRAIAYGETLTDVIDLPGDQDNFVFTGASGQRITAILTNQARATYSTISVRMALPDGSSAPACVPDTLSLYCQIDNYTLPVSGLYTLTVDGAGKDVGAYSLALNRLDNAELGVMYGKLVTDTINPLGDQDNGIFNAVAGQRVSAVVKNLPGNAYAAFSLRLTPPNGSSPDEFFCAFTQNDCQIDNVALTMTGAYTLTVDGSFGSAGAYALALNRLNGDERPIAFGQVFTDDINLPGDQDSFTFNGVAGQRVAAVLENRSGGSPLYAMFQLRLAQPGGTVLIDCPFSSSYCQLDDVTLPASGMYTLTVDGQLSKVGAYTLALNRLDGNDQPINMGQAVSGAISPAGDRDSFVFNGSPGQRVTAILDNLAGGNPTYSAFSLQLFRPGGALLGSCVFSKSDCQIDDLTLPVAGTYVLVVDGSLGDVGPYALAVNRLDGDERPINYGLVYSDTISPIGDQDGFTFTGATGQRVNAVLVNQAGRNPLFSKFTLRLARTDGITLSVCAFTTLDCQVDNVILPASGAYTLTVDGSASDIGPYAVALNRLDGSAQSIKYGQVLTDTISPPGDQDTYVFTGTAGQRVSALLHNMAGGFPTYAAFSMRLNRPDGRSMGLCNFTAGDCRFDNMALPATGVYTLTVDGRLSDGGSYTLRVEPSNPSLLLMTTGPRSTPAGETADYAIRYTNLFTTPLQDTVIVAQLPWDAEYVSASDGGVFWWNRRQVVWKLGTQSAGQEGQFTVRVRYGWGVSDGQIETLVAVAAARTLTNSTINLNEYLAYTPITETQRSATRDEVLAGDPQTTNLYNLALSRGFRFDGAAVERDLSNGVHLAQLWLVKTETREVLAVTRDAGARLIYQFSPTGLQIYTAEGGLSWDLESEALTMWGTWAISTTTQAPILTLPSLGACMRNCLIQQVPSWASSVLRQIYQVLGQRDCLVCELTGNAKSCRACAAKAGTVPNIQQFADTQGCATGCAANIGARACTGGTSSCWSYFNLQNGAYQFVRTWSCNKYGVIEWPPATASACGDGAQNCVNGKCADTCNVTFLTTPMASRYSLESGAAVCVSGTGTCAASAVSTISSTPALISLSAAEQALPGAVLTYVINYANEGTSPASGAFIEDMLPPELDAATLSIENGGVFIPASRSIMWDLGELQPGQAGAVRLSAQIPAGVVSGTTVFNVAMVVIPNQPQAIATNPILTLVRPVVAYGQSITMSEGAAAAITLTGASANAQPLSFSIVMTPSYGTLAGAPPHMTYTPVDGFEGLDQFTFVVSEGANQSAPAEVTIRVHPGVEFTPPRVIGVSPQGGMQHLPTGGSLGLTTAFQPFIWVGFTEPISVTTLTTSTFSVKDAAGQPLPGQVLFDSSTNAARFIPAELLRPDGVYTAKLSTGVRDTSGNPLQEIETWWFRMQPYITRTYLPILRR